MRTISQKRRRAKAIKTGLGVLLAAVIFTPKLGDLDFGSMPFPLVSAAIAAPVE